jgi:hypothetical protein
LSKNINQVDYNQRIETESSRQSKSGAGQPNSDNKALRKSKDVSVKSVSLV